MTCRRSKEGLGKHQNKAGDDEGKGLDQLRSGRNCGECRRDNVRHENARKPAVEEPNSRREKS